jgi:hypothetical protein
MSQQRCAPKRDNRESVPRTPPSRDREPDPWVGVKDAVERWPGDPNGSFPSARRRRGLPVRGATALPAPSRSGKRTRRARRQGPGRTSSPATGASRSHAVVRPAPAGTRKGAAPKRGGPVMGRKTIVPHEARREFEGQKWAPAKRLSVSWTVPPRDAFRRYPRPGYVRREGLYSYRALWWVTTNRFRGLKGPF